ncbi:MAG: hypothetical protein A2W91_11900 [Bacteroidetes bacterium GWF2_38_335]|nr:MAG: hypothetical protein A2W91_11900 [Bacteroidetes bacterium GWF2_38_335]OFY76877.1 MAG: hypothetical protein A2281_00015 [Bacteroidetes bacterium RIFOXYA12_FULL_38_20]HBS86724.1 hypothetical protein [Bacteroidales bacterium]
MALLIVTLTQCNENDESLTDTVKFSENDPFKSTITPSQNFEIDPNQDNVVEGNNGTTIVCPKGCFLNSNGEEVTENVKIELAEALSLQDMILSNLTTTSDGKPLETDGMIYLNATSNGKQLKINKAKPVYIEIPTPARKPDMKAYKGVRDENGNMNWIEPKKIEQFLIPVDLDLLDFLPEGFQAEVDKGMPYKSYKVSTQSLTDSLYYSLSVSDGRELIKGFEKTDYNEPLYNLKSKVVNGKYTEESYESEGPKPVPSPFQVEDTLPLVDSVFVGNCGIDPAIIKVIKSKKYQNTLISTREFETRLQVIFKTCRNDILEIYIRNINKNLYELDSMVYSLLDGNQYYEAFYNFSQQRLTNVKGADRYAKLLKGYYNKELKKVKSELEKNKKKLIVSLQKENAEVKKLADNYRGLLWKREKYRMEKYGFKWTETGWINIDKGIETRHRCDQDQDDIKVSVENGKDFDQVYCYVFFKSIRSLYRLNTTDNINFFPGNSVDRSMWTPCSKPATLISIGYKNEVPSIAVKEFMTDNAKINLALSSSTMEQVKGIISQYDNNVVENRISKDLEFMKEFYKEKIRQKELIKESNFIKRLWAIANPCCG